MQLLPGILLVSYVVTVAVIDTARHRIPNSLTASAALVGLILGASMHGLDGLLTATGGLVAGFVLMLPRYFLGGFGAGDVKAVAAAGTFLGPLGVVIAAVCTVIAGGISGLIVLLSAGGLPALQSMLRRWVFRGCVHCTTGHRNHVDSHLNDAARLRFPYGIAIASGVAATLLLRG